MTEPAEPAEPTASIATIRDLDARTLEIEIPSLRLRVRAGPDVGAR
jgi:hypothetical protein